MMEVAVIGGGLAGLAAAHELVKLGACVTLFEATGRLGGQVLTQRANGYIVEHGAQDFVFAGTTLEQLVAELSLTDRLVSQVAHQSYLLSDRSLAPLAPGEAAAVLGFADAGATGGDRIVTLAGGMDELVTALARRVHSGAQIRRSSRVVGLVPQPNGGWQVITQDHNQSAAMAVVTAVAPAAAGDLLSQLDIDGSAPLREVKALSSVTVSLAFLRSAVAHPLSGSGFVVGGVARAAEGLKACSFASSRFPDRAPPGRVLLRAFYRPGREFPLEASDATWVEMTMRDLGPVLGISGEPTVTWISRWPDALPQYGPDLVERCHELARRLGALGRLQLAGAAFHGVGVGPALRSGVQAAHRLLQG